MIKSTLLFTGLAALALTPLQGGALKIGDRIPNSKYNDIVWNWDGSESINDHLGEPILVDFWGIN